MFGVLVRHCNTSQPMSYSLAFFAGRSVSFKNNRERRSDFVQQPNYATDTEHFEFAFLMLEVTLHSEILERWSAA